MYKNSFIHYLTKVLADIMFYDGILFCIAVPFLMLKLANFFGYRKSVILPFTAILLSSGLCALYFLRQLKAMFKALLSGKLMSGVPYKEGKRGGIAKMYYENGKLMAETPYKDDLIDGIVKECDETGNVKAKEASI